MRLISFCLASLISLTGVAFAADTALVCDHSNFLIEAPDARQSADVCDAAHRATDFFAKCGLTVNYPIRIEITEALPDDCLGLFHCDDNHIQILPVETLLDRRHPNSVLGDLSASEFRDSLLVHELAHAAYDGVECPYRSCRATAEYLAYSMQIMSLPLPARARIEARFDMATKVSRDEISAVMLAFSPQIFIRKSWAHLSQRGDKCAYIALIMDGAIIFDREGL